MSKRTFEEAFLSEDEIENDFYKMIISIRCVDDAVSYDTTYYVKEERCKNISVIDLKKRFISYINKFKIGCTNAKTQPIYTSNINRKYEIKSTLIINNELDFVFTDFLFLQRINSERMKNYIKLAYSEFPTSKAILKNVYNNLKNI